MLELPASKERPPGELPRTFGHPGFKEAAGPTFSHPLTR
jgi:hypothetical protein